MSEPTPSHFAALKSAVNAYESTRDRYWLTRHYVALSTLVTVCIALLAPGSLNARALADAGPFSGVFVLVLATVALASLFEAFVTAFVPRRSCGWLRRWRHVLFMSIGLGQISMAYVVASYAPETWVLIFRFLLDAAISAAVAFLDLFARHKAQRLQ